MEWTKEDVSRWLVANRFEKYVQRFIDEEIDGPSLFYLSSTSIEELLSTITDGNVCKKPTIGAKTAFETKLNELKAALFSANDTVMTLNEEQSNLFIQQLESNEAGSLSILDGFNVESSSYDDKGDQKQKSPSSIAYTYHSPFHQSTSNINRLHLSGASPCPTDQQLLNDALTNSTTPQSQRKFPLIYSLPNFDASFELAVQAPSPLEFGPRCRKKQQLVKTIRDDVVNTYGSDFYPTSAEFDRMVVAVKNKYSGLSKIFGEDMGTLASALKQQFSRDRHVYASPSEVVEKKRLSHGHPNSGRKLKFLKVDLVTHREYLADEKEQSKELLMQLEKQVESMRGIMHNANYDLGQVKAKMDTTYSHRQRIINENKLTKEIIELYPALSVTTIFIREINLHCDPYYGDIVQALKSNCSKLGKALDESGKENIDEEEKPFAVLEHIVMKRFKHSKKLLLNHEPVDAYPMVQTQTTNGIKNYSIVIEYNTLIMTNSQSEALSILIGSYEIFNIKYPDKIRTTLEVLNGLSFKKRTFSLSLGAKRFFGEHKMNIAEP